MVWFMKPAGGGAKKTCEGGDRVRVAAVAREGLSGSVFGST